MSHSDPPLKMTPPISCVNKSFNRSEWPVDVLISHRALFGPKLPPPTSPPLGIPQLGHLRSREDNRCACSSSAFSSPPLMGQKFNPTRTRRNRKPHIAGGESCCSQPNSNARSLHDPCEPPGAAAQADGGEPEGYRQAPRTSQGIQRTRRQLYRSGGVLLRSPLLLTELERASSGWASTVDVTAEMPSVDAISAVARTCAALRSTVISDQLAIYSPTARNLYLWCSFSR